MKSKGTSFVLLHVINVVLPSYLRLKMDDTQHFKLLLPLCLFGYILGQSNMLLPKYGQDIQNSIMTGYGPTSKTCDVIYDNFESRHALFDNTPTFGMDMKKLNRIEIPTTFSSSYCLLISAHVNSNQTLSDLIKFGWSIIQRKRLALVLMLAPGLTLNMAANTTKLPFLVAARGQDGKEQFLCPIIGDTTPKIQNEFCDPTYTSHTNKSLRVGIIGRAPDFFGKVKQLLHIYIYLFIIPPQLEKMDW